MKLILLSVLLCSCSPRPADNTGLPNYYSDMQAAEDAGRTPASSNERPESGGGK